MGKRLHRFLFSQIISRPQDGSDLRIEFGFEVFCFFYVIVVVIIWAEHIWASVLLVGGLYIQLCFWRDKSDGVIMLIAVIFGTVGEILCVKSNVWKYRADGVLLGIPLWVPFAWAFLLCLFRRVSLSTYSVIIKIWPSPSLLRRKVLFAIMGVTIIIYFFAIILLINKAIAIIYSIIFITSIMFCRRDIDILIFLIGSTCGTLGEYICISLGLWRYHFPFFASVGIPVSLPLAWGLSSVIICKIAGFLTPPFSHRYCHLFDHPNSPLNFPGALMSTKNDRIHHLPLDELPSFFLREYP